MDGEKPSPLLSCASHFKLDNVVYFKQPNEGQQVCCCLFLLCVFLLLLLLRFHFTLHPPSFTPPSLSLHSYYTDPSSSSFSSFSSC